MFGCVKRFKMHLWQTGLNNLSENRSEGKSILALCGIIHRRAFLFLIGRHSYAAHIFQTFSYTSHLNFSSLKLWSSCYRLKGRSDKMYYWFCYHKAHAHWISAENNWYFADSKYWYIAARVLNTIDLDKLFYFCTMIENTLCSMSSICRALFW